MQVLGHRNGCLVWIDGTTECSPPPSPTSFSCCVPYGKASCCALGTATSVPGQTQEGIPTIFKSGWLFRDEYFIIETGDDDLRQLCTDNNGDYTVDSGPYYKCMSTSSPEECYDVFGGTETENPDPMCFSTFSPDYEDSLCQNALVDRCFTDQDCRGKGPAGEDWCCIDTFCQPCDGPVCGFDGPSQNCFMSEGEAQDALEEWKNGDGIGVVENCEYSGGVSIDIVEEITNCVYCAQIIDGNEVAGKVFSIGVICCL